MRVTSPSVALAVAFAFAFASCFSLKRAEAREEDRVHELPGWVDPDTGSPLKLPMPVYAGYVNAGSKPSDNIFGRPHDVYMHYVFIEAEESPEEAPLVLWSNGGPGAASLFGLFVELGPFQLSDASKQTKAYNDTGVPTLFWNPNVSLSPERQFIRKGRRSR